KNLPTSSLQLRVLRLGSLQDGDVGVGVLPEGEEVQIGSASFRAIALEGVGAGEAEASKRPQWEVHDGAAMVEKLLELGRRRAAIVQHQVSLATHIDWAEKTLKSRRLTQFIRGGRLQQIHDLAWILALQFNSRPDAR